MGKSTTPTYRVESCDQAGWHRAAWDVKRDGRPTDENADRYRKKLNASFQPGEVNEHIRIRFGNGRAEAVPHINRVLVIRQRDGVTVASARMPAFEVI